MKKVITLDKTKLILIGVILLLILGLTLSLYSRGNALYAVDLYQKQIDSLDVELNHLQDDQIKFDLDIKKYKDSLIVYNREIDSINLNIEEIRNYYGEKISNISNSTPTELHKFITDRYK